MPWLYYRRVFAYLPTKHMIFSDFCEQGPIRLRLFKKLEDDENFVTVHINLQLFRFSCLREIRSLIDVFRLSDSDDQVALTACVVSFSYIFF